VLSTVMKQKNHTQLSRYEIKKPSNLAFRTGDNEPNHGLRAKYEINAIKIVSGACQDISDLITEASIKRIVL
jgi:DNA-directed RNA polymerase subunit L